MGGGVMGFVMVSLFITLLWYEGIPLLKLRGERGCVATVPHPHRGTDMFPVVWSTVYSIGLGRAVTVASTSNPPSPGQFLPTLSYSLLLSYNHDLAQSFDLASSLYVHGCEKQPSGMDKLDRDIPSSLPPAFHSNAQQPT